MRKVSRGSQELEMGNLLSKNVFVRLALYICCNFKLIHMNKQELTDMEFDAYKAINEFVKGKNYLFEITKKDEVYELKNSDRHFKVLKQDGRWILVVIKNKREYPFDGSNLDLPFKLPRHYEGWNILFDNLSS